MGGSAGRSAASLDPWGSGKPQQVRRIEHDASLSYDTYFAELSPNGMTLAHRMEHEAPMQLFRQTDSVPVATPNDMQSAVVFDYNGDGTRMATGHKDGTIRIWDAETLQPIGQPWLTSADEWMRWISLSADGNSLLAITGNPCKLYAIDLTNRSQQPKTQLMDLHVKKTIFAATSDGRILVAATTYGDDDAVSVWDIPAMKRRTTRYLPTTEDDPVVYSVDISSDGKRLAIGSKQGAATIFDTETGKEVWSVAHGGRVSGVRFSPQSELLATCGGPVDSEEMHLWNLSTGKEWVRWRHPTDASRRTERLGAWITMMDFSQDATRLLTAGTNTPICVWSLNPAETISKVVVTRPPPQATPESSGDRKLAEQIIGLGGAVGGIGPAQRYVYRAPQLPGGELKITHVKYYGTNERVTDDDLKMLLQLKNLETVSIANLPELTHSGYQTLTECQAVKVLYFLGSTLDDESLKEIAAMPLDTLTLWHTDVTNEGLAVLGKMNILRELSIGSSRKTYKYGDSFIDDAGLAHLANIPKLKKLWLYGPKFSDESVDALVNIKQLRTLIISASLSDGAVEELRKRMPNCEIVDNRRNSELDDLNDLPEDAVDTMP